MNIDDATHCFTPLQVVPFFFVDTPIGSVNLTSIYYSTYVFSSGRFCICHYVECKAHCQWLRQKLCQSEYGRRELCKGEYERVQGTEQIPAGDSFASRTLRRVECMKTTLLRILPDESVDFTHFNDIMSTLEKRTASSKTRSHGCKEMRRRTAKNWTRKKRILDTSVNIKTYLDSVTYSSVVQL